MSDKYEVDFEFSVLIDAVRDLGTAAREGKIDHSSMERVVRELGHVLEVMQEPEAAYDARMAADTLHNDFTYLSKFDALQDEIDEALGEHEVDSVKDLAQELSKLQDEVVAFCSKFDEVSLEDLEDVVMSIPGDYDSASDVLEALHRLEKLEK